MQSRRLVLTAACLFALSAAARAQTTLDVDAVGGAVITPDQKTLILTVPNKALLLYFDTLTERELKKVELDFKPGDAVIQGERLIVARSGSSLVHVLDVRTGKEIKQINLGEGQVNKLACHPTRGYLYVSNSANQVYVVDIERSRSVKTDAVGEHLLVDPATGTYLFTSCLRPTREQIRFTTEEGTATVITFVGTGARGVVFKYIVDGKKLRPVSAQGNAAHIAASLAISPDGKRIATAGASGQARKAVSVFDAKRLSTVLGQIDLGQPPVSVAFHPILNQGAAVRGGIRPELVFFNAKTLVTREDIVTLPEGSGPGWLLYAAQGSKVICISGPRLDMPRNGWHVTFVSLPLRDKEKEILKKAYRN